MVSSRSSSPVAALMDGDPEVADEDEDVGSCVGSADADVVHFASDAVGDAEGDAAGLVDAVVTVSAVCV